MTRTDAAPTTLTPVDVTRCQAEHREGSFMTLGPRSMIRCANPPKVVARERRKAKDGLKGSMSLCSSCQAELEKRAPNLCSFVTIQIYQSRDWKEVKKHKLFKLRCGRSSKTSGLECSLPEQHHGRHDFSLEPRRS